MKYRKSRWRQRLKAETNSNMLNLLVVLQIAVVLLTGIAAIVLPFANPELTETQLFIEYWWAFLGTAIVLLIMTLRERGRGGDSG